MKSHRARIAFLVLFAAPLSATISIAEDPKTPAKIVTAPETVVVTGSKLTKEEREKVVWDFVYAHAKLTPKIDQLARWVGPVCPEVKNLPQGYADFVVKRIKEVAKAAGAPAANKCKADIEVIFTPDPQNFINDVADKNPKLLGYHYVHDLKKVATVTRPIQAWYATATSNVMVTSLDDPYHSPPGGVAGSRLSHGQLCVFANILILADANKVAGYPIGQIADYLAMISLSQADAPDDCNALPSILDLMSSGCINADKPQAMTPSDKSYLEGLYAMYPDEIGSLQKGSIANTMRNEFETK